MKNLGDLKNVGRATLQDLTCLGISSVEELAFQDATFLFEELERRTKNRQDPCVWDVFASIIHEAKTGKSTNWWDWTNQRKALQKNGNLKHVI
ncbi:MAG: Mitomycin resistance protein mcrB [Chlamydiae bacterium]|nr:Mitomycin resistance protein mcrB [Chlamydiota bacterium]